MLLFFKLPTFLLAGFTSAVNLETVLRRYVMESLSGALLDLLNLGGKELDGIAAHRADHVVMVAPIEAMFESSYSIAKLNLGSQTALSEEPKRAIDGRVADGGLLLLNQMMQFLSGEVIASCQKNSQDRISLRTAFEAELHQVLIQNLLSCSDYAFAGSEVYACLWHRVETPYLKELYAGCREMRGKNREYERKGALLKRVTEPASFSPTNGRAQSGATDMGS